MRRFFFFFLLIVSSLSTWPQTFSDNRKFHYGQKNGLSFIQVNSIAQDRRGFIWIATADGLNRFDGTSFKVFRNEKGNEHSLSSNYVQSVYADKSGRLWVSSREGLNLYDSKTGGFLKYRFTKGDPSDPRNDIINISETRDGNLWLATSYGFYYFNSKTNKFIDYTMHELPALSSNSVQKVFEDSYGLLWVGMQDKGLAVFQVKNGKVKRPVKFPYAIENCRINDICEDKAKNVWIATSEGLVIFNRKANRFATLKGSSYNLKSNIFLSVVEGRQGGYLVGIQDGGLYRVTQGGNPLTYSFEAIKGENGLALTSRSVSAIYQGKDESIWLGTHGDGLYLISNVKVQFKKFKRVQADGSSVRYYGMCQDSKGNLWLGTDGSGIYKTSSSGEILKHYHADGRPGSIPDNAVLSGFKDSKNRLWFGSYQRGLFVYNEASDNFKSFKFSKNDTQSIGGNDIRVIYEDAKHRLWIGGSDAGLNLFNESTQTFSRINKSNSNINSNDVRAIAEDSKGNLWIGTFGGGLNYFDVSKRIFRQLFKGQEEKEIISNNIVSALYLDGKGQLWIGTDGDGLVIYNTINKKVRVINEKSGLANNTISTILAENDEVIWVSTNKGISRIAAREGRINNYNSSDGLQEGTFPEGSALYNKEASFMVFGGSEGWNIFGPAKVRPGNSHSPLLITGLKLFDKEKNGTEEIKDITELQEIELRPDQPVFSLYYVVLDYAFPEKGEFAYKLEGLDKDWNYVKDQHSVTYRYLDPGTYTFKVKAANHDGIWASSYSSILVRVLPPWYKTWWAYFLYTCFVAGAIYAYGRYRTEQARLKYEIKAAHFEAEKEKEIHRKKISFFTSISHEFRTPLTLIINPLKEMLYEKGKGEENVSTDGLTVVYRNARRLLSLVDQLLLFRKSESESERLKVVKLNIASVCQEVFLCFTQQARLQNIDLTFTTTNDDIELFADREKIEIVLFNLISNALKYTSPKGSVHVELTENDQEVIIQVKDTGAGIPTSVGEKLYEQFYQVSNVNIPSKGGFGIGLYLVKSFTEAHQGKVSYTSQLGKGTTFFLNLKKGKNHFADNVIVEEFTKISAFLEELIEESKPIAAQAESIKDQKRAADLYSEIKTILIVDDNAQIRHYIKQLFDQEFEVLEADNGATGLDMIKKNMPDVVISDIMMQELSGIELCTLVKDDPALSHIPIILLTASTSVEVKLKGIECGAEDFITKPFEKEILVARVSGILKSRNNLQKYFYNQITLQPDNSKISPEYKEFLDKCIQIVEEHLTDPDFGTKKLGDKIAMSRTKLYLRIKSVSGQSANGFIRSIRLRKAAEIFVSTDATISEVAYMVGLKDVKYFREQFNKLFGMNPSEYIKRYRSQFNSSIQLKRK